MADPRLEELEQRILKLVELEQRVAKLEELTNTLQEEIKRLNGGKADRGG